jgi:hypothetical protein
MRIKVKIIKETHGLIIGDEKNLRPNIATELVKAGIAEYAGTVGARPQNVVDAAPVTVDVIEIDEAPEADEAPAQATLTREYLETLDKKELKALCERRNVAPRAKATNDELIELLLLV